MKPVFKCDYCSFMGTKDEVKEHEPNCHENYDMKSCYTCKNRGRAIFKEDDMNKIKYECDAGKDVPSGYIMKNCDLYERKEKGLNWTNDFVDALFGSSFRK